MKKAFLICLCICFFASSLVSCAGDTGKTLSQSDKLQYIKTSGEYPEVLITTAEKCPQTIDFVYNYPINKDRHFDIDLSAEAASASVPLLLQFDERWGYESYGSGFIGTDGCGPCCLSMAAVYLTHDARLSPLYVSRLAEENGYCVPGSGSSWTLISEGCRLLGLNAQELPLWEQSMKNALDAGEVIILTVGEGDFTSSGHFLVVCGYDDAGFEIRDPNSSEKSTERWSYERLEPQIRNLWSLSAQ